MDKISYIKTRNEYIELIKSELLGPGSEISYPDKEHELISDLPTKRYSVGILFPKSNKMKNDNNESFELEEKNNVEDDEETSEYYQTEIHTAESHATTEKISIDEGSDDFSEKVDEEINMASQNKPSSFGISFIVMPKKMGDNIEKINCHVDFATYRKARIDDCRILIDPAKSSDFKINSAFTPYLKYVEEEKSVKLITQIKKADIRNLLEKTRSSMSEEEYETGCLLYRLTDQLASGHVREPHSVDVSIDLTSSDYAYLNEGLENTNLKVSALKRKTEDKRYSVTVMLFNDSTATQNSELFSIFQPKIVIDTEKNDFVFCPYTNNFSLDELSLEEQSAELQYRNKKSYGTGLGVSVDWNDIDEDGNGIIMSDFFPSYEVPSVDFVLPKKYKADDNAFSMKYLSDLNDIPFEDKVVSLKSVISAYEQWINELKQRKNSLGSKYFRIAEHNIMGCEQACIRMKKGLEIITKDEDARLAFMLANRAMFMQRVHLKMQLKPKEQPYYPDNTEIADLLDDLDYYKADEIFDDKFAWRPFQIGFLLMSIEGIVNDKSDDRELIDLIWFPTGGGKTEAYLGLTAFSIFFRRLHYPDSSDGTTVIMRYTLRLLTAQQFTRASTLICACEYIRQGKNKCYPRYGLGDKEISIGLWIGGSHTPNDNKDAKDKCEKLIKNPGALKTRLDYYNKFQVLKCPWCGTSLIKGLNSKNKEIGEWGYVMHKNSHFQLRCTNENCFFDESGKLPVQIVDQELYDSPPTLLFATVDKFAMMPWREEVGNFFATNSNNRAPELIIQDELHLISGPLGTMVGLYETAIDYLCRQKGVVTKVIASTATIKKAVEQCSALYNREVAQFPHPGLDYDDSFFSKEKTINYSEGVYGRTYLGILPAGKTKVMTEALTIAAMMQKLFTMDISDDEKDKFWSLVLYFNSLKDLGKCSSLLDDDVKDAIRRTAGRFGEKIRNVWRFDELTSRVSTSNLNSTMDTLEKVRYISGDTNSKPIDAVLATNMISVGIDISRLNAMLIVGQPKLTSEYIQASSRIGREYPGAAFILYDATKSRDRSHYEQFKSYHQTFYKFVEPTVATPFSGPARDRALHAVLISMIRHKHKELLDEAAASKFRIKKYQDSIDEIKDVILKRQKKINTVMNPSAKDDTAEISKQIDDFFVKWEKLATAGYHDEDKFFYGRKFMVKKPEEEKREGRLMKTFNTGKGDDAVDTMTSMRSVDVSVNGQIIIWEKKHE